MEDNAVNHPNSNDENEVGKTDKPIMDLFQRLIRGDTKQTLTDAQLIEILQNEFQINMTNLHFLEKDIYLTVMKKFLKVWPEWAEFDIIANNLKNKTKFEKQRVFEQKYINIKKYLKSVLDTATPLAKDTVKNVLESEKCHDINEDVVLEIKTSRESLNNLFFRYPNLKFNNTIFNIAITEPPQTRQAVKLSLPSILNWWDVKVFIFPPFTDPSTFLYCRQTNHDFKYVLVNKRLAAEPTTAKVLDQEIKVQIHGRRDKVKTNTFIDLMTNIGQHYSEAVKDASELFDFVLKDLSLLPPMIMTSGTYKRFTNKYPYVRYLYEHVDHVSSENYKKYDIQLEETIRPGYQVTLGNMQKVNEHIDWAVPLNPIIVECLSCSAIFKGSDVVDKLKEHFWTFHQYENDFSCSNCLKKFGIETLSSNWWCHKC